MIPDINILAWITGAPVAFGIVVAVAIAASIWGLRVVSYYRDPTPYRLGDYKMEMPHQRQSFKVTLFQLDFQVDTKFIETLKTMGGPRLAEVFEKNKDHVYFYIAKHLSAEATTKDSGISLVMTNAPFDHSDYFIEQEEHMNWIKGYQTRQRKVLDSGADGFYIKKTGRKMYGQEIDFIYYTPQPIAKNPTVPPKQLEMIEVVMSAVANADQYMITMQKSQQNEIRAKAAESAKEKAESELKKKSEELNFVRRQWSKKDYWASSLATLGGGLSLALAIGIVGGCAILLPDFLARQLPGYTSQHYIGLAVAIGAGVVWLVSLFRKG